MGFIPAEGQDLPAGIIAGSDYESVPVPSDKYQKELAADDSAKGELETIRNSLVRGHG